MNVQLRAPPPKKTRLCDYSALTLKSSQAFVAMPPKMRRPTLPDANVASVALVTCTPSTRTVMVEPTARTVSILPTAAVVVVSLAMLVSVPLTDFHSAKPSTLVLARQDTK